MNLQLSDQRIRATCRELLKAHSQLSGRQLCAELRTRFGAVGKTVRVFRIWREETASLLAAQLPGELALLKQRLHAAESTAAEYLKRAELAEYRERANQDHWAIEIDKLKMQLEEARRLSPGKTHYFPV